MFLKRLRWRVFYFDKPDEDNSKCEENYGLKTSKTPPPHTDLAAFENEMYKLINDVQFKNVNNDFQCQLQKDVNEIKKSENVIVRADKTTNLYHVNKNSYNKLLAENITKDYKKAPRDTKDKIDQKTKMIANDLKVCDRMEGYTTSNCFITLKDHKDGFQNNPKCRLLNPAKTDLGRVSKTILENVVKEVKLKTGLNLWRNTADVKSWFSNIKDRRKSRFIQFDIEEFYPSITPELLDRAIQYASTLVNISDQDISIINHAKKPSYSTKVHLRPKN